MMINDRCGQRIVYYIILGYSYLLRVLSAKMREYMGKGLGLFFFLFDSSHRRTARINLAFAYGNTLSKKEIRRNTLNTFFQFGMIVTEWCWLKYATYSDLDTRVSIEGIEHLHEAKKSKRSVILLSAHFGNWEYAHLHYARKIGLVNFIVRRVDNVFLEKERCDFNRRFGVSIMYKDDGLRNILKKIEKGEDLVIFPDGKVNHLEGIPAQFFGKKTSSMSIVSQLAMKYQLPVVPMFIVRSKDLINHRLIFFPALPLNYEKSQENVRANIQLQNDILEKVIRSYPDHWFWFHRKWKMFHPEIYKKSS